VSSSILVVVLVVVAVGGAILIGVGLLKVLGLVVVVLLLQVVIVEEGASLSSVIFTSCSSSSLFPFVVGAVMVVVVVVVVVMVGQRGFPVPLRSVLLLLVNPNRPKSMIETMQSTFSHTGREVAGGEGFGWYRFDGGIVLIRAGEDDTCTIKGRIMSWKTCQTA